MLVEDIAEPTGISIGFRLEGLVGADMANKVVTVLTMFVKNAVVAFVDHFPFLIGLDSLFSHAHYSSIFGFIVNLKKLVDYKSRSVNIANMKEQIERLEKILKRLDEAREVSEVEECLALLRKEERLSHFKDNERLVEKAESIVGIYRTFRWYFWLEEKLLGLKP